MRRFDEMGSVDVVVLSNFTLPNDVVIDKKGRYFDALFFVVFYKQS